MSFTVSYYCPHCGAFVELDRDEYLADKSVTPEPLDGWTYASPDAAFESADGVGFHCGEDGTLRAGEVGCGERFFLNFVRFEAGVEVPGRPSGEHGRFG